MSKLETVEQEVDFCVVGGGLAGLCAAVAAARHGVKTAIMQDRPMFGGNCSSEIRMWICGAGAHGSNLKETGLLEELELENCYRNPYKNYSIWDSVMYQMVKSEKNIKVLLNCSCLDAEMEGNTIKSVTGWQMTTQTFQKVKAKIFADCSGDSILAPLTGAKFRRGREARSEFGEDIAPEQADSCTMGMSCMIQGREYDHARKYIPPKWAEKFTKEKLPHRQPHMDEISENFWFIELGGTRDEIKDTEEIRDELQEIAYGLWDYVKNSGECPNTENWDLDWVGMLPGKRESRRYVGDYIMTQNDVRAEGRFDDLIAYGGWTMDDHHPEGIRYPGEPTIFHPAPAPYGIAYRCLYSANIDNLMFAGRNISVTHTAMSSTRVMGTCGILGQAVGTAAAIALEHQTSPRGVAQNHIRQLQQTLMEDDCYLPFHTKEISALTKRAKITADGTGVENLTNGKERPILDEDNGWYGPIGSAITFSFEKPEEIHSARLVFDSDLERRHHGNYHHNMDASVHRNREEISPPATLVKKFRIEYQDLEGNWIPAAQVEQNYQRLVKVPLHVTASQVRFIPEATWGSKKVHMFSLELR